MILIEQNLIPLSFSLKHVWDQRDFDVDRIEDTRISSHGGLILEMRLYDRERRAFYDMKMSVAISEPFKLIPDHLLSENEIGFLKSLGVWSDD